tara:strand:+ start:595 stop:1047 length:453 start_codon:yes stop_codon:yes gene_type:complete
MIDEGKNAYGRSFIKRHQDLNDLGVRAKMMVKRAEKRLREMLASHYRLSGTGSELEHETKGLVKGFCEALVFGRILKPDQINDIIHDEHLKIFGMTKEARMLVENSMPGPWTDRNWDRFDKPTIERRGPRKKPIYSSAESKNYSAQISVS